MPPRRSKTDAFQSRHPVVYASLVFGARMYPALILLTMVSNFGVLRRPWWQRVLLWKCSYWSFMSRYVLVAMSILYVLGESDGIEDR